MEIIYKYLRPCRVDVLKNQQLRFTQASALNDPLDALPSVAKLNTTDEPGLRKSFKSVHEREPTIDEILRLMRRAEEILLNISRIEVEKTFLFLSLATNPLHPLMWAHYADCHRGFVIGFDPKHSFFVDNPSTTKEGLRKVEYKKRRYDFPLTRIGSLSKDEQEKAKVGLLLTKGKEWRYEQEWRLIGLPDHASKYELDPDGKGIYLFDFPPDCVREVLLGYAMDVQIREELTNLLHDAYPDVKCYECKLHETEFRLVKQQIP